jgi:hypothetical protein
MIPLEHVSVNAGNSSSAPTTSHDSLLRTDREIIIHIDTATSSTDDLSLTHQLSSSAFHSKDSALGLSDDNLNCLPSSQLFIRLSDDDDDDNDDDDGGDGGVDEQRTQIPALSLAIPPSQSKYQVDQCFFAFSQHERFCLNINQN